MNIHKYCPVLLLAAALTAHAQDHWVGTWSTAPVQTTNTGTTVVLGAPAVPAVTAATPPAAPPRFAPDPVNGVGRTPRPETPAAITPPSPATVPARPAPPPPFGSSDTTLRQIVHISLGGSAVRVVLTNEYGSDPLLVGAASVTNLGSMSAAHSGPEAPSTALTFGGKPGIVIPPNAIVLSDPIPMKVDGFADLSVNLFIPMQPVTHITRHTGALQTSYTESGNTVAMARSMSATPVYSWSFLKTVEVLAPANTGVVVAFGDSITDGAYASRDQNARWPDDLARRLAANPKTRNLAVLNEGIGGNRVLHDNTGPSALARFTRDALDQPGVKYIIVLEAINDIGNAYRTNAPKDVVSADDLIQGYQQLIERAHVRGIKVIMATLTPYGGASYGSPAGEQVRQAVNQWIRTTKASDGVIDFDKATLDPAHPDTFLPAYDHGDHLHPTDAGLKAMADAIDLTLFTK